MATRDRTGHYSATPEYKREYRRKVAERAGLAFRPGLPGPAPDMSPDRVERDAIEAAGKAARDAWREWISVRAPQWWIEVWAATKHQIAAKKQSKHDAYSNRAEHYSARKVQVRAELKAACDGTIHHRNWDHLFAGVTACGYCGVGLTGSDQGKWARTAPTIDHVKPLSRGGVHGLSNVVVVCRSCNASKGKLTMKEWWPSRSPAQRRCIAASVKGDLSYATND